MYFLCFFFFKQKTAYEIGVRLVGSEMCIRDSLYADKILYLKKGKIEDFGKAEEVIRRNRYFEKYTESAVFQDSEQFIEGGAR